MTVCRQGGKRRVSKGYFAKQKNRRGRQLAACWRLGTMKSWWIGCITANASSTPTWRMLLATEEVLDLDVPKRNAPLCGWMVAE